MAVVVVVAVEKEDVTVVELPTVMEDVVVPHGTVSRWSIEITQLKISQAGFPSGKQH